MVSQKWLSGPVKERVDTLSPATLKIIHWLVTGALSKNKITFSPWCAGTGANTSLPKPEASNGIVAVMVAEGVGEELHVVVKVTVGVKVIVHVGVRLGVKVGVLVSVWVGESVGV